jgi:hypothetical protein
MVEHLSSKGKALSSNPSTTKKKKKKSCQGEHVNHKEKNE